ncbi:MAG: endonuclease/exonuclease/phosphatase family protein [Acidimicrobiia bacterium]|nr:endonuclease/exonuclease/phosphatase family protein [Acidimicrobiia bacterium]
MPAPHLDPGTTTSYGPLAGGRLRVLTWNLWWQFGPWEERLPAIVETVRRLDPDIACLQEVWIEPGADGPDGHGGDSSARRIGDALGFEHRGTHRLVLDEVGFGNAVVSRWPITGGESLPLPGLDDAEELRTCFRADIDSPHGPLQVFSTHLNWRFDQSAIRQEQVRAICAFIAGSPPRSYPPVLAGDFNALPDSDEVRMLTGRAAVPEPKLVFHDAWEAAGDGGPGHTWSNSNPFALLDLEPNRRIDYVFAGWPKGGGRGQVLDCEVVGTEPVDGIVGSDHYGVIATLRI